MSDQKLIVLRGYPGSGKTTIGKKLQARGIGTFIDHNAILTFITNITGDDEGIYDAIAHLELAMCAKLLKQGHTVIVARGFSKSSSIDAYENIAIQHEVSFKVIKLEASKEILARRVASPERRIDFNPTVTSAALNEWIINNPIQERNKEIVIDNEKPLDRVMDEIVSMLLS